MTDEQDNLKPGQQHHEEEFVAADDAIIGKAFKWSLAVIAVIGVVIVTAMLVSGGEEETEAPTEVTLTPPEQIEVQADPPNVSWVDITKEAGVDFIHHNGATGDKLLPETMGGGVAFIDYDNDGDQDLLFANGTNWAWDKDKGNPVGTPKLYNNDGTGKFTDATQSAGLDVEMYGMGLAIGDINSDGWVDVFFANVGKNLLLINRDGKFVDETDQHAVAGLDSDWSACAAFFDYDNDNDLDLYVGNYVQWSREIDFEVDYRLVGVGRSYGPPMNFKGTFSNLYRNDNGVFADVSQSAGIHVTNKATENPMGKALGVTTLDIDGDNWVDIFVANDTVQNFLYHNQGDGSFKEVGVEYGIAFDRNGHATGAMGIDAGYYRNTEDLGFFIGNFANEMTSLYVSQGMKDLYADEAIGEGIGSPTRLMLSFGVTLLDYDLDGRLDLLQTNGHLEEEINLVQPSQHYEQPSQLFWNCGLDSRGCFVPVSGDQTGDLSAPIVGRGSAFGDIDNDGDLDVVFTQVARRPLVLRNDQSLGHNWIRLVITGPNGNATPVGARVEVVTGDTTQVRFVAPTRSYLSQSEVPITVGIGKAESIDALTVVWPSGEKYTAKSVSANKTIELSPDKQAGTN